LAVRWKRGHFAVVNVHRTLFVGCKAISGTDTSTGGALYLATDAEVFVWHAVFRKCIATSNTGSQGGAIFLDYDCSISLYGTNIESCVAQGPYGHGGGISSEGFVTMANMTRIYGCSASSSGNSLYIDSGVASYVLPTPPGYAPFPHSLARPSNRSYLVTCSLSQHPPGSGCPASAARFIGHLAKARPTQGAAQKRTRALVTLCATPLAAKSRCSINPAIGSVSCLRVKLRIQNPSLVVWLLSLRLISVPGSPWLIGATVAVLSHGGTDADYPMACAAGLLGSFEVCLVIEHTHASSHRLVSLSHL
jgi:hypothetical protein